MQVNHEASIQAVDYIIQKTNPKFKTLDKLSILKLLFFAERYSLRKFATSITNDTFVAMERGPVASATYDIISFKSNAHCKKYASKVLAKGEKHKVKSNSTFLGRDAYDELSDNDIEALDFAINTFGKYSSSKLVEITHRFKEWAKFEEDTKKNHSSYPMDINDFFSKTTEDTKEYSLIPDSHVALSHELFSNGGLFVGE